MKTLILLRHAKSSWDGGSAATDFDRPLSKRGRRAARTIGRELRTQGIAFDRVIASPAARVVETIEDFEEGYGSAIEPSFDRRVYLASPATLLAIIREADDSADKLLLVGHNPGLEALAMLLTRDRGDGLRQEMAVKYPTATVAEIRLGIGHWRETEPGTGELARFIRPRDLDPELGPESGA
jgi:phosphohistidine phosphatase